MKVGRPTNYTPQLVQKAIEYIEQEFKRDEVIPTAAGLALFLGIPKSKLYIYAQKHAPFRTILESLNALQEKRLLAGGLTGKLNSAIVKLVLAKHGYKESHAVDVKNSPNFSYGVQDFVSLE